jgi:hypothetical protein
MAMNMCAPFWWSSQSGQNPPEIRGNGTVCYVNTGTLHIGITCDHVFQGYLDDKAKYENVECQFGNNRFDPETRLIDRSPLDELDLATFDVPEVFVSASPRNYHHNALKWPPDPANEKDVLLHGGYPQVLRNPGTGQVEFPFQWFATRLNSVNSERLVLEPDVEHVYWPGHEGEKINTSFGGQSGGPVYRVIDANREKGELLDRLELVGFIDRQIMGGHLVLAKPATYIRPDGTMIHK